MGVAEILLECATHGIRLVPDAGMGLTVDAPQDVLTPELIDRLRANKDGLLAILAPKSGSHGPTYEENSRLEKYDWIDEAFSAPTTRPHCRCHKEQRWWRSTYGDHLICGICHPPVSSKVVSEWCLQEE